MKFEVINEELKIAACRLADLKLDQVQHFLEQWNDGSSIGALTLFYDRESGYIVLNRDNKAYEQYLEIAEGYLGACAEERETIEREAPEGIRQTVLVLKGALAWRKIDNAIFQARKNCISDSDRITLFGIIKRTDAVEAVWTAFRYGVMCGKRAERAKRKTV